MLDALKDKSINLITTQTYPTFQYISYSQNYNTANHLPSKKHLFLQCIHLLQDIIQFNMNLQSPRTLRTFQPNKNLFKQKMNVQQYCHYTSFLKKCALGYFATSKS